MSVSVLVPALMLGLLSPAQAQVAEKSVQQEAPLTIKVYQLRNAVAEEAVNILHSLLQTSDARLIADGRTNSVIAHGPPATHQIVEALLLQLDEPGEKRRSVDDSVFEVIQINQANANSISQALKVASRDVRLSLDPKANRLLVSGTEAGVAKVRSLVKLLDVPRPRAAEPVKMRVIWLTTEKSAAEPGPHLTKVIKSLERVGITGLRQKTQVMANVTEPGSDFSVRGVVGDDTQISVTGQREGDSLQPARLDVSIDIRRGSSKNSIDLRATVTLGVGQMVVLGATPTGDGQSVFVVELIPGL